MHDLAKRASAAIQQNIAADAAFDHRAMAVAEWRRVVIEVDIAKAETDCPHLAMLQLAVVGSYADDLADLAGAEGDCKAELLQRAVVSLIEYIEKTSGVDRDECGTGYYMPAWLSAIA